MSIQGNIETIGIITIEKAKSMVEKQQDLTEIKLQITNMVRNRGM